MGHIKTRNMKQTANTANINTQELPQDGLARALPSNVKAEQSLLGCILTNNGHLDKVREFLLPRHFFNNLHQKIYQSIVTLVDKGVTADPITLNNMFTNDEIFVEAGGIGYLGQLTAVAVTAILNSPHDYGKVIYDLAVKRHLIEIAEEVLSKAYKPSEIDSKEQIEQAENKLFNLAVDGMPGQGFVKAETAVLQTMDIIDKSIKSTDHIIGISSGLANLDDILSGFQNSDLVIVAGRPSMGKTAFAMNFALNACKTFLRRHQESEDKGIPFSVGFFSLEMSTEQLVTRALALMSGVLQQDLKKGQLKESDYNKLRQAAEEFGRLPLYIDDTPLLSISAVRTRARNLKRRHNLGILFVDYLQLVKGISNIDNRVLEVSEITQGLKAIAKELNIPVIALSQLSRAVEQRADKKPMLSDLRESGSIEQDADIVMFLYREEYYLAREMPSPNTDKYQLWIEHMSKVKNMAEILVAKHRNGPIGNAFVRYLAEYSRVDNLSS